MIPQRQTFTLPAYTTRSGRTLKHVQIGFETYGELNATRDNVILICHYFSGTAHAAGRYTESDPLPGWWDGAIGPGKAIDTDRYFVICSDTLCCIKAFDGRVVTTGPATIDPETGKPYGRDFPLVGIDDFVHVQKALLDHLGIDRLVAVAGPSAGSAQAIQWAVEYPQMVPRVLAVISPGLYLHPYARSLVECWAGPILSDSAWQDGGYPLDRQPMKGLIEGYRLVAVTALSPAFMEQNFGNAWADPERNPARALEHEFRSHAATTVMATANATQSDANHFLYMLRACCTYNALPRIGEARARFLFLPVATDLVFPPFMSARAVEEIRAAGGQAELVMIDAPGGHFDGLHKMHQAADTIRAFLADEAA